MVVYIVKRVAVDGCGRRRADERKVSEGLVALHGCKADMQAGVRVGNKVSILFLFTLYFCVNNCRQYFKQECAKRSQTYKLVVNYNST